MHQLQPIGEQLPNPPQRDHFVIQFIHSIVARLLPNTSYLIASKESYQGMLTWLEWEARGESIVH